MQQHSYILGWTITMLLTTAYSSSACTSPWLTHAPSYLYRRSLPSASKQQEPDRLATHDHRPPRYALTAYSDYTSDDSCVNSSSSGNASSTSWLSSHLSSAASSFASSVRKSVASAWPGLTGSSAASTARSWAASVNSFAKSSWAGFRDAYSGAASARRPTIHKIHAEPLSQSSAWHPSRTRPSGRKSINSSLTGVPASAEATSATSAYESSTSLQQYSYACRSAHRTANSLKMDMDAHFAWNPFQETAEEIHLETVRRYAEADADRESAERHAFSLYISARATEVDRMMSDLAVGPGLTTEQRESVVSAYEPFRSFYENHRQPAKVRDAMMAGCDVGDKGKRDDRAVLVDRQVHALLGALGQGL